MRRWRDPDNAPLAPSPDPDFAAAQGANTLLRATSMAAVRLAV
jgi:hypothetical protein